MAQPNCNERVSAELRGRVQDIRKLWTLYQAGDDSDPDLGTFNEYGLSFDYVAPGTFREQRRGYFRYQLSCGGPSDEFRFFVNPDFSLYRVEYWFLDWFDGARKILKGKNYDLLAEVYEFFNEVGSVEAEYEKGR